VSRKLKARGEGGGKKAVDNSLAGQALLIVLRRQRPGERTFVKAITEKEKNPL